MHSLRFKITAITIAAILTTVVFVFFASVSAIQALTDRSSVEMMSLISHDTGKSLEKYTEDIEQSVSMVANIASSTLDSVALVKGGVVGSISRRSGQTQEEKAQLDDYLVGYCAEVQSIFGPVASHTHGVIAYYYCIDPEISSSEHGFYYVNVGKTGFVERESLDARQLESSGLGGATWYLVSVERGRPSWIGPYTDESLDDRWVCSYTMPIYKAGALIGIIGMDIPADVLIEQVSSIKVYETGFACLLDAQGRVIYHPNLPFGSEPDMSIGSDILMRDDSGNELIRYVSSGQERQMSFTTLSNGMKLVVVAPTDEVNASSIQLIRFVVPVTLLIIVVFAILSLLLMRAITNPLLRLTAAAQRLADADYDVELNYESQDEVGSLTNAFQRMRDQLKESIEDLHRKATTDDLTGLPNQRYFFELAEEERIRIIEEGKLPVLLYFNLAGMKHFNRQYGYDEGDKLMCEVAQVLARHFSERNTSRFGQDHFAVVTCSDHLEARLREVFRECRGINGGKTLPVNVGIYCDSLEVVSANIACDRAKYACDQRRGSYISGFRYFDEGMLEELDIVRYVIEHLDQALEEQWVQVYYQPIVRAANGRVCDEEALSRWIDPVRGFLSPVDFIPALEGAGLIYKLDLHVLDMILEKMRYLEENGFIVVPHSVNLSRTDFESCDIVEEIRERVDAAGIARDKITIEITESIIGRDFGFMKKQIERFQELGFPVWMDDFGSGYSSLDVLQSIQFDLIKFDMSFVRKLDEGDSGKIILTEMMKMATALGVDTICEGVETEEQCRFLREIGCSKLQGFYFSKPTPLSGFLERCEKGEHIDFENQDESDYFEAIGRLNLYDLAAVASEDENSFQNIFDTLPMAVMEISDDNVRLLRSNRSYRDFAMRFFGFDASDNGADLGKALLEGESPLSKALRDCRESGTRVFFDDQMPDGSVVHSIIRRIKSNPVTGTTAVALAVLSVTEPNEGATYADIARALARDYYNIYYVDLDTGRFIEYRSPVGGEDLALERHGDNFFEETVEATKTRMYEEDRDGFLAVFTKENIIRDLDERGVFTASYRLVDTGTPMYVNMKVTRMEPRGHRVIMGISIV